MTLLVRFEILGLFVKPLTVDTKYSTKTSLNAFILKIKPFSWIFYSSFRMYMKFWMFSKKIEPHSLTISQIIHSEKRWLLKSIACYPSELLSAVNVLTGPKHYRSLQESTFYPAFLINLILIELQIDPFSQIWNLTTVC